MSRMARNSSPTSAPSSPKSPRVGFAEGYVTGISRPLSNSEHWTLYYFETHAAKCKQCFEPLNVSKLGKQLCGEGNDLAVEVARLIFRRRDEGVYSREKEGTKEVRVEMPHDYVQTMSLLKAIQRSLRKGQTFFKPRSQDRTYYVPERRSVTPEAMPRPESMPRYDVREVTPSTDRDQYDSYREPVVLSKSRRGSLYGSDMREMEQAKRAAKARFNLELREPRRYSTYS